jgi:amino-acid N-acetyltransferase
VTTPSEVPPVLVREATPADLATVRDLLAATGLPRAGLDDVALVLVAAADGAIGAAVALLTETGANYFPRFGFTAVDRDRVLAALAASVELQGACPASAHALLRPATELSTDDAVAR